MGENNLVLYFEGGPLDKQTKTIPAESFKAIMDAPVSGTNLTAVYRVATQPYSTEAKNAEQYNYRFMRLLRYTSPQRNYLPDFHKDSGVGLEETLKTLRALKKMASNEKHEREIGLAVEILSCLQKNADSIFTIGGFDSWEACKMMAEGREDAIF